MSVELNEIKKKEGFLNKVGFVADTTLDKGCDYIEKLCTHGLMPDIVCRNARPACRVKRFVIGNESRKGVIHSKSIKDFADKSCEFIREECDKGRISNRYCKYLVPTCKAKSFIFGDSGKEGMFAAAKRIFWNKK